MKTLYDEIGKLKQDKECLIIQLIEMDELRDENGRLQEQILILQKSNEKLSAKNGLKGGLNHDC